VNSRVPEDFPEGDYVVVLAEAADPFAPAALARSRRSRGGRRIPHVRLSRADRLPAGPSRVHGDPEQARRSGGLRPGRRSSQARARRRGSARHPDGNRREERDDLTATSTGSTRRSPRSFKLRPLDAVRKIAGRTWTGTSPRTQRSTSYTCPSSAVHRRAELDPLPLVPHPARLSRHDRRNRPRDRAFAGVMGTSRPSCPRSCLSPSHHLHGDPRLHPLALLACPPRRTFGSPVFTLVNKFLPCTASIFAAASDSPHSACRGSARCARWGFGGRGMESPGWPRSPSSRRSSASSARRRMPSGRPREPGGPVRGSPPVVFVRARFVLVPRPSCSWRRASAPSSECGEDRADAARDDSLDYIDHRLPSPGHAALRATMSAYVTKPDQTPRKGLDPGILRGLHRFGASLEADPASARDGRRPCCGGSGTSGTKGRASGRRRRGRSCLGLEQLLLQRRSCAGTRSGSCRMRAPVVTRERSRLRRAQGILDQAWREAQRRDPALADCSLELVGAGVLQAKIAHYLVPT